MAPRANWKGYLRLSLVSCPVMLFPATSSAEKTRFHQINCKTGNRIKMQRIDAETGEPVEYEDVVKGFEIADDQYVDVTKEELEAVALEGTHTIEIDKFVPRAEIDELYLNNPYFLVPDGEAGAQAYAVIREAIKKEGMVALGRVVLTTREHVIAIEPRGKGLVGITLRYPYEVRDEKEFFDEIPDEKITKDMLDLAKHIVKTKSGHFDPEKFEDHYENALKELLKRKAEGKPIEAPRRETSAKVINLMEALRRSVKGERESGGKAERKKARTAKAPAKPKRMRKAG